MKKFAKMSLVAAVAVAGMTSTVSAKDLTEAIKGVDVSGTIVYRYNDYNADDAGGMNNNQNYYKMVVNTKSPVNDDVTANVSVAANNNFTSFDTRTTGDSNVSIDLTKVNFAYTGLANTSVIVGKQGIPTPWTVASDSDSAEHTGTGILALSTMGPVTLAAAYFNQTNLDDNMAKANDSAIASNFDGAEDIATVGAMAKVGPVALDAWYISLMDEEEGAQADVSFDSYTVGLGYSVDAGDVKLGLKARYTNLEFDKKATGTAIGNDSEDNSLWYATLSAKMGIFGAAATYGATDKDGGLTALDNDAKTGLQGWNTNLNGLKDADMMKFNVNAQVMPELNVALNFNEVDSDATDTLDHEEVYTQVTYKMSKNFMTYVRYGAFEKNNVDSTVGRLQVQYSF